ncbi:MAG: CPBP family intramembrane glutamic endopeptidase [Telluria sp.]
MPSIFRDRDHHLRNGWKVLCFYLVCIGLLIGMLALRRALPPGVRHVLPEPWVAAVAVLAATRIFLRLERATLASVGLRLDGRAWRQAGLGLVLGAALMLATALLCWLLGGFHLTPAPNASLAAIAGAGAVMLGAALMEEIMFRGYPFQRAIRGMGARRAVILFAILFVLAHPMGPEMGAALQAYASLNIFLAGVLLGLCYLRTGSLALPVGLHLGWNWSMETLGFAVSGNHAADSLWVPVFDSRAEWLTGGSFGLEASAVSLPVLGLAVAWFALRPPAGLQSRDESAP